MKSEEQNTLLNGNSKLANSDHRAFELAIEEIPSRLNDACNPTLCKIILIT
jgi:hypothetical protein